MKQFAAVITILACLALSGRAQTFTERLQKKVAGQGTVTIHQDAGIDELVNGTAGRITASDPAAPPARQEARSAKSSAGAAVRREAAGAEPSEGGEAPAVDTRKKVMRGAYRVNGFRVQAFAGGNTRRDRQRAEQIGNNIKQHFPDQPVYVHFYTPRWICRVGNYRTYEEAHQMLTELRKRGYKQALIVKGKITIQY